MKTTLCRWLLVAGLLCTASAQAQDSTFFIAEQDHVATGVGDSWSQSFTIKKTSRFILRFTSDDLADAAVVRAPQLTKFTNNETFTAVAAFRGKNGTKSLTLMPGDYAVAFRNKVEGDNTVSLELDKTLKVPAPWVLYGTYFKNTTTIKPGAKLWQAIQKQANVRLFVDGCNSGLETYLIDASELPAFKADQMFSYLAIYSGSTGEFPGNYELKIKPGRYYLCFRNPGTIPKGLTYTCLRYVLPQ